MTKGKPWTVEEETQLKALVEAKAPLEVMAEKLGRNAAAVMIKIKRLSLTYSKNLTAT